jgi:hypothetical protein
MRAIIAVVPIFLVACIPSSKPLLVSANWHDSTDPPVVRPDPKVCPIVGRYLSRTVAVGVDPPACMAARPQEPGEGDIVDVSWADDGVNVTFPGMIEGTCNGGKLRGCTLTTNCDLRTAPTASKRMSSGARVAGTIKLEWTFDETGFVGTTEMEARHDDGTTCRTHSREDGTAQVTIAPARGIGKT